MCRRFLLALPLALLVGCVEGQKPTPLQRAGFAPAPAVQSLYERMGGEEVIVKVVDDFVANVAADPNIKERHKKHFQEGDVAGLKKKLVDQIGEAAGGPQKYTGKRMKEAHQGLEITDDDFDALVGDLVKALDKNKVGPDEKGKLLQMLGTMRADVVEKPK
jgi:hemoglobin